MVLTEDFHNSIISLLRQKFKYKEILLLEFYFSSKIKYIKNKFHDVVNFIVIKMEILRIYK